MTEFTISELGSLGEFASALAVIASLIYVGIQIKQNTNTARISTMQAHVDVWNDIVGNFCQSPELASIWRRGITDMSALNEVESVQFFAQTGLITRYYESSYLEWKEGVLDDRLWRGIKQTILDTISYSGYQQWWKIRRHWFYAEFREFIDEVIESDDGHGMYGEGQTY
jgi:hypothetical protein